MVPVAKTLLLDLQAEFVALGREIPERIEAVAIGPQLADGGYSLLLGIDNDFSIADVGGGLVDVYTDGSTSPVGGDAMGRTLFATQIFSLRADLPQFVDPVPEPSGAVLLASTAVACVLRRNRRTRTRRLCRDGTAS